MCRPVKCGRPSAYQVGERRPTWGQGGRGAGAAGGGAGAGLPPPLALRGTCALGLALGSIIWLFGAVGGRTRRAVAGKRNMRYASRSCGSSDVAWHLASGAWCLVATQWQ